MNSNAKKLSNNSASQNKQWCNDIDAQKIIENREETIKFLTDENRRLKKEVIDLKVELENVEPALKRQREYIIQANQQIMGKKGTA